MEASRAGKKPSSPDLLWGWGRGGFRQSLVWGWSLLHPVESGGPSPMLSLDTFSCAPWRSMGHVWKIIRGHKIYQQKISSPSALTKCCVYVNREVEPQAREKPCRLATSLTKRRVQWGKWAQDRPLPKNQGRLPIGHPFPAFPLGPVER